MGGRELLIQVYCTGMLVAVAATGEVVYYAGLVVGVAGEREGYTATASGYIKPTYQDRGIRGGYITGLMVSRRSNWSEQIASYL